MHTYLNKEFAPDQIETQKSIDQVTSWSVDNFIGQNEFQFLQSAVNNIEHWPEQGKVSKYYGSNYSDTIGKKIKTIFEKKLYDLVGDHVVDFFAFQEAIQPWKIHADARWYPDRVPQYTIVIPLNVLDSQGDNWKVPTYSLTFRQKLYKTHPPKKLKGTEGNNQSQWKRPCENKNINGITSGFKIDRQVHEKYLSHMDYSFVEGLDIENIFEWKPRSVIVWSQAQLHCASNFLAEKIKTKQCLLFMTNFKS